ncbi:M9 family metallopeptidase [Streptomyces sp. NPDC048057]|uniref:M9 family metallopeptidase n=1 Tax=Streptomyces sp. NPDC048057 TaxID=3155628 RepID=UPI0033FD6048
MRPQTERHPYLAALVVALALCLGVGALPASANARTPQAQAQAPAAEAARSAVDDGRGADGAPPLPLAVRDAGADPDHVGGQALAPEDRPPLPSSGDALRRDYDDPVPPAPRSRPSMRGAAKANAACAPEDFTGRTGAALVRQITQSTTECVGTLFQLTGDTARGAFREAQMVTVAQALRDGSAAYPGNGSTGMPQLVLYLRAGYYVHWYHPQAVGDYGPTLTAAIRGGLDAFFASPRSRDVTDANGETLAEAVTLIDSAEENARYLPVVHRLLDDYSTAYDASWYMLAAVNNVFTVLFRGHQVPEFVNRVQSDPSVTATLHRFASGHLALLGTDRSYLVTNAGRELGRFLQYERLRATVRPQVTDLLGRTAITGRTAPLWVGLAEMADAYDRANCAAYGVCDLQRRLAEAVLPVDHSCGASLRIRAQQMTAAELADTCASLTGQDAFFHSVAKDSGPVANDRNTRLEVVVFDSGADYRTYAGAMYGISTDNGGMYLEGDPSAVGNQARFIAYEAEWLRPSFEIWNLNHEYTHYLDGRFNLHGGFEENMATPTVWWIEGFAEYVSYAYRKVTYDAAIAEAGRRTHALSTLFSTTYAHDTTRVYRWGYLAVRYLLQSRPDDAATVLGHYRTGAWNAARAHLADTVGTRYDSDWYAWLSACAAGNCDVALPECTAADARQLERGCVRSGVTGRAGDLAYLYVRIPAGVPELTVTTSGGSGDADLYHNDRAWATKTDHTARATGAGTAKALTVKAPAAGVHYFSLAGTTAFSGVTVAARF